MDLGLKGKKVIMNGGAHGLGLQALKLFAAEGADVAFFSRKEDKIAAAVAQRLAPSGRTLLDEVRDGLAHHGGGVDAQQLRRHGGGRGQQPQPDECVRHQTTA